MVNWLSELDDSEQKSINVLNDKGLGREPKKDKEVGLFDGAASAPFRGVLAGGVKVVDTAMKPIDRIGDHLGWAIDEIQSGDMYEPLDVRKKSFEQIYADNNKERRNKLVMEIDQLQDTENTGTAGNILFGVSDFATRALGGSLVGGPIGAVASTGLSETNYSYQELRHKGVDEDTAIKVAATDGAVAGVSAALPISWGLKGTGGIATDALASVGGSTALSVGGQAFSGEILKSNDYVKQAKKYEITGENVGTELALNALLFGASRYAQVKSNLSPEKHSTAVESSLALNEIELDDLSNPVKTSDAVQENNHLKNMDSALNSLNSGKTVKVPHKVEGQQKQAVVSIPPSEYKNIRYDDPRLDSLLHAKADQMNMDWAVPLLLSIRRAGEKSNNNQVSSVGAKSIMQIMPKTQEGLERNYKKKWDINNPEDATEMALYLVKEMSEQYKTKDPYVLAAHYNGGFANGKAMQKNGKPKAQETINYVNRVRDFISGGESAKYNGNNVSKATAMDGSSYDVAYEVKALDDLITSNDSAYGMNPNYPSELQPRNRTREASRQQIEEMANDLRPEWLAESAKLQDGAPIIGMDNVVESGNGRTLAINKAYEIGKAEDYRNMVESYAKELGIDISAINKPVLVRKRLTETDRVQFTKLANESDVAHFSATERAKTDSDRLPDSSLLKINNDGSINLDGSMDFVRGFIERLPTSERANVMTSDGRLSQDGKRRIESAIAQNAYGDSSLISRLAESLDDDSKTVLNALLRSAPQLAQLGDLVKQGGRHYNTLAKDLAQAAQKLSDLKANGLNVDDYLKQELLFDDGLSTGAKDFLNVFDQNKRSAKGISENIQSKIDEVEAMGDPRQGSLFGDSPEEAAALDIILNNPDQEISVSRIRPDGEPEEITMTLRERLDELEAEAKQSQQDILASQTAISCALQFGA